MTEHLRDWGAALAILALSVATPPPRVAAQDEDEVPLTLTGCVVAGQAKDSYFIKNMVVGGSGASKAPAGAFYRLDSTKDLKGHVGHKVEIAGVADLDDMDKGTLKIEAGSSGQSTASVRSERRTVTADVEATEVMPLGLAGSEGSMVVNIATYKFKVSAVRMLSPSCS